MARTAYRLTSASGKDVLGWFILTEAHEGRVGPRMLFLPLFGTGTVVRPETVRDGAARVEETRPADELLTS